MNEILDQDIRFLKGIGEKRAELFRSKGVNTLYDLFFYLPFRHEDRSKITFIRDVVLPTEGPATFFVSVHNAQMIPIRSRGRIMKVILNDGTGYLTISFFNSRQVQYYSKVLKPGVRLYITGKPSLNPRYGDLQLTNFEFEVTDEDAAQAETVHTNRVVPVYSEIGTVNSRFLRTLILRELKTYAGKIEDPLPASIRARFGLASLSEALAASHFPETPEQVEKGRIRLAFDRFFYLGLYLQLKKRQSRSVKKNFRYQDPSLKELLLSRLPFKLTAAQRRVLGEIDRDLLDPYPMNRLLQGDVGSGKTVVALLSALQTVGSGFQAAIMAPTEILAGQHWSTINRFLEPISLRAEILTGGMKKKDRQAVLEKIASGACRIVVGTHALIQDDVAFKNLSFVVIDEQHKFGVEQRRSLIGRGIDGVVDLLVMTATPIPRTLSLTLYGDLELSVIDELPPGRKPVVTKWYGQNKAEELYGFIREEIASGEKAYFIYPLVEESEKVDLKNAETMFAHFRDDVFKGLGVGLIHGRMKPEDKEKAMNAFKKGELKVLVATTVVEVGMDVPDATIIVVENAERFGLAQLHQLRGRIGRGDRQSFCLLVTSYALGEEGKRRMDIMRTVSDGFKLAEEDLKLRGPGEFLGTRQSGLPDLYPADIVRDGRLLETCRQLALELLEKKISLTEEEKSKLWESYKREVRKKYEYIHSG